MKIKMGLFNLILFLIVILVLGSQTISSQSIESNGGQIKVIAIDDSYTDSYYYLHTHGTDWYVDLYKVGARVHIGWLKFDISEVPDVATGISATLRLSFRASVPTLEPEFVDDAPRVDAHYCSSNNWDEESITYHNQPSYSTSVLHSKLVYRLNYYDDHWFTWDVTEAVLQSLNNNKDQVSIVMEIHPNSVIYSWLWFDSKENWYDSPELIVEWSGETQFHTLMITSTVGGTTEPGSGSYTYAEGTNVQVTAIPDTNYELAYWELDGSNVGSENPITVLMDSNHTAHAVFELLTYNKLTILSSTDGTTDPTAGTYYYVAGSSVNVAGIPNPGYSFDYWLLDGEERTENPITVMMDTNHTLEAAFVDDVPPEIDVPIQEPSENITPYQNVTVTANVTDLGTGVYNVTLWYSISNGTTWTPLNMTENSTNTYQATIPGYENRTWITYKIIAYDNNTNEEINDNHGYCYIYCVIAEFPSFLILPIFVIATLLAVIAYKRKHPM